MVGFTENKFVVEKEIDGHCDDGGENEGAGGLDEFVGKWDV